MLLSPIFFSCTLTPKPPLHTPFQLQPPLFRFSSLIFKCHRNLLPGLSASNWFSFQSILSPALLKIHFSLPNSGLHQDLILPTPLALHHLFQSPYLLSLASYNLSTDTLYPRQARVLMCPRAHPNRSCLRFSWRKIFPYLPRIILFNLPLPTLQGPAQDHHLQGIVLTAQVTVHSIPSKFTLLCWESEPTIWPLIVLLVIIYSLTLQKYIEHLFLCEILC